jgi:hypothetical protein
MAIADRRGSAVGGGDVRKDPQPRHKGAKIRLDVYAFSRRSASVCFVRNIFADQGQNFTDSNRVRLPGSSFQWKANKRGLSVQAAMESD